MNGVFYMVVRIFIDSSNHNSVEYFKLEDYASVDALYRAASARFHNIISADLQNQNVVYQQTYIMDNGGTIVNDGGHPVVYDRRPEPNAE